MTAPSPGTFYGGNMPTKGFFRSRGTLFQGDFSARSITAPSPGTFFTGRFNASYFPESGPHAGSNYQGRKRIFLQPPTNPNPLIGDYKGDFFAWAFPYPRQPDGAEYQGRSGKLFATSLSSITLDGLFNPAPVGVNQRSLKAGSEYQGRQKRAQERKYAPFETQYTDQYLSFNVGISAGPKVDEFRGTYKSYRINTKGDLHPSYRYMKNQDEGEVEKGIARVWGSVMNWLFNKGQPSVVRNRPDKEKYDKREAEIWY